MPHSFAPSLLMLHYVTLSASITAFFWGLGEIRLRHLADQCAAAFSLLLTPAHLAGHLQPKAHQTSFHFKTFALAIPLAQILSPKYLHDSVPNLPQSFAQTLPSSEACLDHSLWSCNPLPTSLLFWTLVRPYPVVLPPSPITLITL